MKNKNLLINLINKYPLYKMKAMLHKVVIKQKLNTGRRRKIMVSKVTLVIIIRKSKRMKVLDISSLSTTTTTKTILSKLIRY